MNFVVNCRGCKATLKLKEKHLGRRVQCRCGAVMRMPKSMGPAAPASRAPESLIYENIAPIEESLEDVTALPDSLELELEPIAAELLEEDDLNLEEPSGELNLDDEQDSGELDLEMDEDQLDRDLSTVMEDASQNQHHAGESLQRLPAALISDFDSADVLLIPESMIVKQ